MAAPSDMCGTTARVVDVPLDGYVKSFNQELRIAGDMGAVNWMTRWFRPDGALSGAEIAAGFEDLFSAAIQARR